MNLSYQVLIDNIPAIVLILVGIVGNKLGLEDTYVNLIIGGGLTMIKAGGNRISAPDANVTVNSPKN